MKYFRRLWAPTLEEELRATLSRLERELVQGELHFLALTNDLVTMSSKISYIKGRLTIITKEQK